MSERTVAANARTIAILTALARVAGFLRMVVFAATVGATAIGTVYQSTNTIPNVIYEVAAGGVLSAAAVPLLAGRLRRGDRGGADAVASALLTWVLLALVPLAIVVVLASQVLVRLVLDRSLLGPEEVSRGGLMLAVFAPQIVLYGIGIVLTGVLHAHRRFVAAALAPLVSSLVVIATYLTYGAMTRDHIATGAVWVLAVGTTLGVVAMVLTVLPSVRASGFAFRPRLRFPDDTARRALALGGAGLVALLAQQVCVVATLWLTNHRAGTGTINGYQYVQATYLLPHAVLAVPIATATYPVLAGDDGRGAAAAATLARALRAILLITGAAAAAMIAAAGDIGGVFAAIDRGRASVGAPALHAIPDGLTAFAPGIVGLGLSALLTRALYVRGRPSRAAVLAGLGWLVAAGLPFLLSIGSTEARRTMLALGIGSSVGMLLAAAALAAQVRGAWGPAALAGVTRTAVGVLAGAVVAILIARVAAAALWAVPHAAIANLGRGLVVGVVAGAITVGVASLIAPTDWRFRPSRSTS